MNNSISQSKSGFTLNLTQLPIAYLLRIKTFKWGGAPIIILLSLLPIFNLTAQFPCLGVTSDCLSGLPNVGDPNTYKCIDATSSNIQGSLQNAITAGLLVPVSQSASTIQRVVIKGQLRIDVTDASGYTFPTGSVIVLADNSSEISVRPSRKLSILGTLVTGCGSMWNQIDVLSTGTLILQNSTILDGTTAVNAQENSTISIIGNEFRRNFVCVKLGNVLSPVSSQINYASGGGIWGNQFLGTEVLKSPLAGNRPLQGIFVNNIGSLTIGGSAQNFFENYSNTFGSQTCTGLGIFKSSVTVSNARFAEVGRSNSGSSNASIYVKEGSLTLSGLGNSLADQPTIFFSPNIQSPLAGDGIQLLGSSSTVNNAKISGVRNGIYSYRPSGSTPAAVLNVNNASFIGFREVAVFATVNPAVPLALNFASFKVENCFFDDNALTLGTKGGIWAQSLLPSSGKGFRFANNQMYHRARPTDGNYKFYGFYLTSIDGASGIENTLIDEGTLYYTTNHQFKGILMGGCKNINWSFNNITGNTIPGVGNEFAFEVFESPSCYYSCNYMNDLVYGMQFSNDCSASRLTGNNFNNHQTEGISLAVNGTTLGQQIYRDNIWNGNTSGKEAYLKFSGYNPNNFDDAQQVRKSLFRISTTNTNSSLWANPRIVETGGNDPNWFLGPQEGPIAVAACSTDGPSPSKSLDAIELKIIDGTYFPYRGFAASTWDAAFHVNDKLLSDPSLRPDGSPEKTWYQNNLNSNLGKLAQIYRGIINLTGPDATGSATQLLNDLNAVNTSLTHEQNLKTVLQIGLETIVSESSVISEEKNSQLRSIAQQCRYQGGVGVAMARAILKMEAVQPNDCPDGLQDRNQLQQEAALPESIEAEFYPNPAKNDINIKLTQPLTNGQLRLINLAGQVVRNWNFNGDQIVLPLEGVTNGLYLIEINNEGQFLKRSKITVVK